MDDLDLNSELRDGVSIGLIQAARDTSPAKGLTHEFYRYPARFSATFVRAIIKEFTKPGDWVVDPFVGGGTTLVEAMALGRNALGIDISSLSSFICEAKTQILTNQEISAFERWVTKLDAVIHMHAPSMRHDDYANDGYYKNLEGLEFWRLRKAIEQALSSVERLRLKGSQTLARCVVLKTAQWALDSHGTRPSIPQFRAQLEKQGISMLAATLDFRNRIQGTNLVSSPKSLILNRTVEGAEYDSRIAESCPPKLIVTSPPYPGIHVLYHRWQVDGRRETPAPFWIAGKLDGAGSSYYTMGDRKSPELQSYFKKLTAAFKSIAAMADEETVIAQIVGFSDHKRQLPKYLDVMEKCGLKEIQPWGVAFEDGDGRIWRDVPRRRWYVHQKIHAPCAREVILIHRKMVL